MIGRQFLLLTLLIGSALLAVPASFAQSADASHRRLVEAGSQHLAAGDHRGARDAFEQALSIQETDAAAHLGLGIANSRLGDDRAAETALRRAIELQPGDKRAYELLGALLYRRDDLGAAIAHWEKALELVPSDAALGSLLERRRREYRTEKAFHRDGTSLFSIKYEGREQTDIGRIVLRILEDAHGEIGRALSWFPQQEVAVILYSRRQFREVTEAPGWSGGLYDGKIRIPVARIAHESPALRRLLFHEYTHAVVHSISGRAPTWLNEGLAQHFEGREIDARQREVLRLAASKGKLPSLQDLESAFRGLNGDQASFAYLLSLSAVRYLVDHFGIHRIRSLLDDLATGADTAGAVRKVFHVSYEDLDRGWARSIE